MYASMVSFGPCALVKNICLRCVMFFLGSQYSLNFSLSISTSSLKSMVLNTFIASSPATWRNVAHFTLSLFSAMPVAMRYRSNFWIHIHQFSFETQTVRRLQRLHGFSSDTMCYLFNVYLNNSHWHQMNVTICFYWTASLLFHMLYPQHIFIWRAPSTGKE